MKAKSNEYRNYKSKEEAIEVFKNNVEKLESDYLVFYILPDKTEDKEELIDIIDVNDMKTEAENSTSLEVIAKGEAATKYEIGDKLIGDPRMAGNYITVMFDDCLYVLLSEKAFMIKLK